MKHAQKSIYILLFIFAALFCFAAAPASVEEERAHLEITANGAKYVYVDEKLTPSDFTVEQEITLRRINAPLEQKIELVDLYLSHGADHKTALGVCFPRLVRLIGGIAEKMYVPPEDASVVYDGGKFRVKNERRGAELDESKLYASIYCCFKFSGGGSVTAEKRTVEPEVTAGMIKPHLTLRGSYSTDYASSLAGRKHNIRLALGKLDGIAIMPGETLSFNKTVGPRTEENGFQSAKIIVDGAYTDGVGGGVCQASTAVYNAALVAGLSCTANAHSICPSYCPPGLDAMISSVSDLLITNPTEHPVYISVKSTDSGATVFVYGEKRNYDVVPESVIVKRVEFTTQEVVDSEHKYFDGAYEQGDRRLVSPGKDGVSSETYLNYYSGKKLIRRELLRKNEYKSVPQVIAVAP